MPLTAPPALTSVIDIRRFGAVAGAADNTAPILAAVAALTAGDILYFPSGTWIMDGTPIKLAVDNITIRGAGWSSIIKLKAGVTIAGGVTGNLIELASRIGWVIEDLALDLNGPNNTSDHNIARWHGVYTTLTDHLTIRRVKTINTFASGIFLAGDGGSYPPSGHDQYPTIENCWLDGGNVYDASNISMTEGGIRLFADHALVKGNDVRRFWKQVYIDGSDSQVIDNRLLGGTIAQSDANGLEIYRPTSGGLIPRHIVRGNRIDNVYWQGIQIGIGTANSIVENNIISAAATTGTLQLNVVGIAASSAGTIIRGNQITGFRTGIFAWNGAAGGDTADSSDIQIEGNSIYALAAADANQEYSIYTLGVRPTIRGNICDGRPVYVSGGDDGLVANNTVKSSNWHGIYILNGNRLRIEANEVYSAAINGILFEGGGAAGNILANNHGRNNTQAALYVKNIVDSSITGNVMVDNAGGYAGILMYQCTHIVVTGNRSGRTGTGTSQDIGIQALTSGTGCDYITVANNDLSLCRSWPLTLDGLNSRAHDNIGYDLPRQVGRGEITTYQAISQLTTPDYGGGFSSGSVGTVGTVTARTVAPTNLSTALQRTSYVSAATASSSAMFGNNVNQALRGNAAGLGGFVFICRFQINATTGNLRLFIGLDSTTGTPSASADPSALTNFIGVACDAADANLQVMTNDGSGAATKTDLGANFAKSSTTAVYEVRIHALPNDSVIYFEIRRLDIDHTLVQAQITANMLTATSLLCPQAWINNGGTAVAVDLALMSMSLETP